MKKAKKIISLILAVIMVMSVVPMQIFALGPTLEKIEFSNNVPVSNQEIQNEVLGYENIDESTRVYVEDINYDEYYTDYKLYFSNGQVCDTADYYLFYPVGIYNVYFYPEVSPVECQRAIDEGLPFVNVYITVTVENIFGAEEVYEFVVQKNIVEGIVKDIRLVDSMPEIYDEDYPSTEFIGKTFEVEYFDGRVETQKVVADENFGSPYLKNDYVYFDFELEEEVNEETGEKKLFKTMKINYLDIETVFYKEEVTLSYSDIKILDYKFDKKGGVTYIKYSLTHNDGSVIERECSFKKGIGANDYGKCDVVDGHNVTVYNSVEDDGGRYYFLKLSIGYDEFGVGDVVYGKAKDCCSCICHQEGFMYVIGFFLLKIWTFFKIKEQCKCNAWHWI